MSHDIVARLRDTTSGYAMRTVFDEAADEIERLRAVVEAWLQYSQRAERDIETLRAERDEARRLFCKLDAEMYGHFGDNDRLVVHRASYLPSDAAKKRGWDCFKEKP